MTRSGFVVALVAIWTAQAPAGVIDGHVVDDAGGPVPAATVTLVSGGRPQKTILADERGFFAFDALAEGTYTVSASQAGHATRSFGQLTTHTGPVEIALTRNGRIRVGVRLPRFGAISGVITDEYGQPASVQVRVARFIMRDGRRVLEDREARSEADRLGRYRFADLQAGDYLVSALGPDGAFHQMPAGFVQRAQQALTQPGQPAPSLAEAGPLVSYVPVYYPSAVRRIDAAVVTVAPGEERANISVRLQLVPTARIHGTIVGADGAPAPYTNVRLIGADDPTTWSYGSASASAYFRLAPVPYGPYRLLVAGQALDVTVAPGAPPLTVRLDQTASVAGRTVFEGTSPTPDCRRVPCRPVLTPRGPAAAVPGWLSGVSGVMEANGPVVFRRLTPGPYIMAALAPIDGWTLESAVVGDHDLLDVPIEVATRQDVTGLVLTFTDRPTVLSGTVPVGADAPAISSVTVVIFPADRRLWAPGARRVRVVRPDTRGEYRVAGLPPGEYRVATVTNFNAEAELDASALAAYEPAAVRVMLKRPARP